MQVVFWSIFLIIFSSFNVSQMSLTVPTSCDFYLWKEKIATTTYNVALVFTVTKMRPALECMWNSRCHIFREICFVCASVGFEHLITVSELICVPTQLWLKNFHSSKSFIISSSDNVPTPSSTQIPEYRKKSGLKRISFKTKHSRIF